MPLSVSASREPLPDGQLRIQLDQQELYERGLTSIVLGAESLIVTIVGQIGEDWKAYSVNLRSMTAFGGTVRID